MLALFAGDMPPQLGDSSMKPSPLSGMQFTLGLREWLRLYSKHLAPQTIIDNTYYIPRLERDFRTIAKGRGIEWENYRIDDVTDGDTREYQDIRQCGWRLINKELGIVKLCRDQMRQPIIGYKRLPKPHGYKSPGKVLTKHEEEKLKRACVAAADHRFWNVAALCTLLSIESGLGPGEIRHAKLRDITWRHWDEFTNEEVPTVVFVSPLGAKRKRRIRQVAVAPAPDWGEWALERLLSRAARLGSVKPDHYLLPAKGRWNRKYDPTQPCGSWKAAFQALCATVGIKMRRYDCRHHAFTVAANDRRLTWAQISQHFGHVSEEQRATYFHGDVQTSKVVAAAIVRRRTIDSEEAKAKKPSAKVEDPETKKCPECWSDIPVQARRCRYCQAILVKAASASD